MTGTFDAEIAAALRRVLDPCSVGLQRPVSILDLGLVLGWEVDEHGAAEVRMCVTSPSCQMAEHFLRAAEAELQRIEGITSVRCFVEAEAFWTPRDVTTTGQAVLDARRRLAWREYEPRPVGGSPADTQAVLHFTGPGVAIEAAH